MLLAAGAARASIWQVPHDCPTIQAAIDNANAGDTILVDAGTYRESLQWWDKDLIIQGAGPGQTIIDPSAAGGGPGGRCLYAADLTTASKIEGFTFQGGQALGSNYPDGIGGGIFNYNSNLTVTECAFSGNAAGIGGGMDNANSTPTLINCTFTGNSAVSLSITSGGYGGGMENDFSSPIMTNCTFAGNTASRFGGGMFSGGVNEDPTVTAPVLTNCTFAGNASDYQGGAMYNFSNANPTLTNCIVWGNTATDSGSGLFNNSSDPIISHTDSQDFANITPDANGNFGADPLFVRNPGTDGATDFGDLHLTAGSPCLNAGDNNALPAEDITDLDGNNRIADGTVDLGAYEYNRPADTTPPTLTWGTATPAPNAAGWNNTPVDLSFTTADDLSGVASVSAGNPLHFASEGAGQTQTVTVTDNAGNSAQFTSPAVNIDLTAPTTTASATGTTTSTVTLSATDNLSGVNATYYSVDGGPQQSYTGSFTLAQGLHWVRYCSVDKAGNQETVQELDIDTRFAVTVSVASASGKRGGKVTLSATVTQSGSSKAKLGGKAVTFTVDGVFAGNAVTSKQGVASVSFTIPTSLATGPHTIAAVAQPDGTYQAGYATGTLTVTK
jgi:hypothetical protein